MFLRVTVQWHDDSLCNCCSLDDNLQRLLEKRVNTVNYWATFAQTINHTNRAIGSGVAYASIAMALVTTGVVILRYGFGQGAIAAQESVLYLHGTLFMLGAAPTLLADKHVRVDVFYRNFSPASKLG